MLLHTKDPIDVPPGASIRRPDPTRPFVAMSNRHRWGKCALSAVLPQVRTPSGPAAQEGTEAHKVAEWALTQQFGIGAQGTRPPVVLPPEGLDGFDYIERSIADWQAQVGQHAINYANHAAALFSDCDSRTVCMIETKIEDVTIHGVRVYTVADVMLWNAAAKRLVVGDYKYGRSPVGIGTATDPNAQVAGTAALWLHTHPHLSPDQIGLFVYQPRIRFGEAYQQLAPLAHDWLAGERTKLGDELLAVREAADQLAVGKLVDPVPGDHCTYCPSARWCPAAAAYGTKALEVDSGKVAVVDLTPEQVMALWAQRKAFDEFSNDLKERVRMLHENNHPGVQARRRTGSQMWASPQAVVEALMLADRYDLLQPPSVSKVQGVLPDNDMAALVTRAPDVLTYVATDGKQPDIAHSAFAQYLGAKP